MLQHWTPKHQYAWSVAYDLRKKDPALSLQIDVALSEYGSNVPAFRTREDLEELIAKGKTVYTLKNPITQYATKNDEEAFCEALGMYVAFGRRTLHSLVFHWLKTILPNLKIANTSLSERLQAITTVV